MIVYNRLLRKNLNIKWIREGLGLASTLFFIGDLRGDDIEKFGYAVN